MFSVLCPPPPCQGELPYPESREIVVPKGFHLLQSLHKSGLCREMKLFPFCLSPFPLLGQWVQPASSPGLPMALPQTLPLRTILCWVGSRDGGTPSWRLQKQGQGSNSIEVSP